MTRVSSRTVVGALAALAVMAGSLGATAWTQKGPFSARIHGHEFESAEIIAGDGCSVSVKLRFEAPKDRYQHAKATLNVYRFRARVQLSEDKQIVSKVFNNRQPGARSYQFEHDTSPEGCWSKQAHKLRTVDVEGCHGRGCRVDPFR